MDHAFSIYVNCSTIQNPRSAYSTQFHHSAIRIATGAFRTTLIASLPVKAHEHCWLYAEREILRMRYALKLRQFPSHPTFKAVFSLATLSMFDDGTREWRGRREPFSLQLRRLLCRLRL